MKTTSFSGLAPCGCGQPDSVCDNCGQTECQYSPGYEGPVDADQLDDYSSFCSGEPSRACDTCQNVKCHHSPGYGFQD